MQAPVSARRHDVDTLRVLAFALLILYHVGMYYVADWHWHLKSPHAAQWLQMPMQAVNLWRMDLVFLVSGLALGLGSPQRSSWRLFKQRSFRLLLPLGFGMLVIVPYQPYAQGVAQGLIAPGFGDFLYRYVRLQPWPPGAFDGWAVGVTWNHLWFLAYLWVYTAIWAALQPLAHTDMMRRLGVSVGGLRGGALLILPVLPLMVYSVVLWPRFPPTHDLVHDGWLHAVYFTLFLYGSMLGRHVALWGELVRLRGWSLALAAGLWLGYVALREVWPSPRPQVVRLVLRVWADAYLWAMLVALLGWAHHRLNRPWAWLPWARESVYPWYLLHQTVIIALAVGLVPLALGPYGEPLVLLVATALVCAAVTAVVRRVAWLRPWMGLPMARR